MGQAKRRGDLETRKAQSIERQRLEKEERERKAREAWDAMTPEEQEAYRTSRRHAARIVGLAMALGGRYGGWV